MSPFKANLFLKINAPASYLLMLGILEYSSFYIQRDFK